jgi:hypothetical protein
MKTRNHTIHRDFTLETLNRENQHSFGHFSLLLSYSFKIKGYMSNLGPHLRHNRHHTLLHKKEQPCNQIGLHMHDQQPTLTHSLTCKSVFYDHLTTTVLQPYNTPIYRIYNRKNPKHWHPKKVTDPCISLATNPANPRILLQLTPSWVY